MFQDSDFDESNLITSQNSRDSKTLIRNNSTNEKDLIEGDFKNYQQIDDYQFVIGIVKPGFIRMGLLTAERSKVTISGRLGIKK